jgi:hypothetical protein
MQKIVESVNVTIDEEIPHRNKLEAEEMDYIKREKEEYKEEEEKEP